MWFNKVSAKKLSGWVRTLKPNGQLKRATIEVRRINENLVKAKIVDEADGSVVTETATRVTNAAATSAGRRTLRSARGRRQGVFRRRQ